MSEQQNSYGKNHFKLGAFEDNADPSSEDFHWPLRQEGDLKMRAMRRLLERRRNDPAVEAFFRSWIAGYHPSFELMLIGLATHLSEQCERLRSQVLKLETSKHVDELTGKFRPNKEPGDAE